MHWESVTGIHWPKSNRKLEWDQDLSKTAIKTMGFVHLDNGI